MYVSKVKSRFIRFRKQRICQGDILRGLEFIVGAPTSKVEAEVESSLAEQYWVVMTQDCDLSQDFSHRLTSSRMGSNSIRSILLCPAYPARQFYLGEHLKDWDTETFNNKKSKKIMKNDEYKRYHYVKGEPELGVPEFVVDFKHFFTAPVDVVYAQRKSVYIATIGELYREELSQRFTNFLSRIGLPDAV